MRISRTASRWLGRRAVVSPHIGTLDSPRSIAVFAQVIGDLQDLYGVRAQGLVCDAHPRYAGSRWARAAGLPVQTVWHHHAHAAALAGEHAALATGPLLVFCWDGVGLGVDGTLWGGEVFLGRPGCWRRVASLRPFRLPGGERVAREPWRSAASLHWEAGLEPPDLGREFGLLHAAWAKGLHAPWTSSAGRLFDAAAALVTGLRDSSYEAQGPMQLEALASAPGGSRELPPVELPWTIDASGLLRLDWQPLLGPLAADDSPPQQRARLLHRSLGAAIAALASRLAAQQPIAGIGLAGGVFQNRVLVEDVLARLADRGLEVLLPQRLPANDAAIAFGQLVEAGASAC
ncbi:MAG: hypothetical protein U1F11_11900 [Steroidobacteraceae bacterium]